MVGIRGNTVLAESEPKNLTQKFLSDFWETGAPLIWVTFYCFFAFQETKGFETQQGKALQLQYTKKIRSCYMSE